MVLFCGIVSSLVAPSHRCMRRLSEPLLPAHYNTHCYTPNIKAGTTSNTQSKNPNSVIRHKFCTFEDPTSPELSATDRFCNKHVHILIR